MEVAPGGTLGLKLAEALRLAAPPLQVEAACTLEFPSGVNEPLTPLATKLSKEDLI